MKDIKKLSQKEFKRQVGMETATVTDLVTTHIRELLIFGEFRSGQQLRVDEFCTLFSVSRPTIREAFKTLEGDGLLLRRPRKGVYLPEFTTKDVEEVYALIAMLHSKATEMAMDNLSVHNLRLLEKYLKTMTLFANQGSLSQIKYQEAHKSFHETILELAGNQRMIQLEKQLRYQTSIMGHKSFQGGKHLLASLEYHRRIFVAISDGNKTEATGLMEEHVMRVLKYVYNAHLSNATPSQRKVN